MQSVPDPYPTPGISGFLKCSTLPLATHSKATSWREYLISTEEKPSNPCPLCTRIDSTLWRCALTRSPWSTGHALVLLQGPSGPDPLYLSRSLSLSLSLSWQMGTFNTHQLCSTPADMGQLLCHIPHMNSSLIPAFTLPMSLDIGARLPWPLQRACPRPAVASTQALLTYVLYH